MAALQAVQERLSANEVALGDLRQTVTAQAVNADNVRVMMEQVAAQITQMATSHERLHQELAEMRRAPGGSSRRPGITPKDFKLEILGDSSGPGFRQQWHEWSDKAKDYLSLRLPDTLNLRQILTRLESRKEALNDEEVKEVDLDPNAIAEIRFFLKNNTTGYPYDQLTGLGDKSPLEMWRTLAQSCDPLSHEGNFTDSQMLHYPKRAKNYEDLPSLIASWKRNMERWSARTG